jgi:hypothetical protein
MGDGARAYYEDLSEEKQQKKQEPITETNINVDKFEGCGGNHYKKNRVVETCILMEQVAKNVFDKTQDLNCALWSAMAMKHLDRVGTKDIASVEEELEKVENYAHKARTKVWKK